MSILLSLRISDGLSLTVDSNLRLTHYGEFDLQTAVATMIVIKHLLLAQGKITDKDLSPENINQNRLRWVNISPTAHYNDMLAEYCDLVKVEPKKPVQTSHIDRSKAMIQNRSSARKTFAVGGRNIGIE